MAVTLPFPHRLAGHCASGAFRDMFEWRGYRHGGAPVSEGMVFGLGAGLDVLYMRQPTSRLPFYLGGRGPVLEESLVARIGGRMYRHSETDNDDAWRSVRARLDAGEPVMLVGDCQKLEYLKTRTSMPLHVIVATGYDDTHALIADNDRAEIQRCSLESLRAARSALGFPLPAMNVTFEIEWPDALPPLESMVMPAIREFVSWMRAPSGAPAMLFGAESFGLEALARLEEDAHAWAKITDARAPQYAQMLWVYIVKAGTGGALFRTLYRDFLAECVVLRPSAAMRAAHSHYAALADGWAEVGALCASGSLTGAPERVVRLAQAEREGVALLARIEG